MKIYIFSSAVEKAAHVMSEAFHRRELKSHFHSVTQQSFIHETTAGNTHYITKSDLKALYVKHVLLLFVYTSDLKK